MALHGDVVPTQGVFRALLRAMSRPGTTETLPRDGWDSSLAAVCETLLDHEVSFCAVGEAAPWSEAVFAATKSPRADVEEADFVVVSGGDSNGAAARAKRGEPEYPDLGATVVYVIDRIPTDAGAGPMLSGPGIDGARRPDVNPLSAAEWSLLREINDEYPLGVDAVCLVGPADALCVPRSTRIGTE